MSLENVRDIIVGMISYQTGINNEHQNQAGSGGSSIEDFILAQKRTSYQMLSR